VARFLPSLVLGVLVMLLSVGVSAAVIRIPGMAALFAAMLLMAVSETIQARSDRRGVPDRRGRSRR
jgi:hypothetical protein